ncbi:MAG: sensor histidine kinase, partial [Candidatus Wallbacteria bacterium]|nr:sensor histidine kinase [Candidatus Wallbacteria bacterium]
FIGRTGRYRSVSFLDPSGAFVAGAGPRPSAADSQTLVERAKLLSGGEVVLEHQGAGLFLVTPVRGKQGTPIGCLVSDLNRPGIARPISHVTYAGVGYGFLTDRQGAFLFHPLPELLGHRSLESGPVSGWGLTEMSALPLENPPRITELFRGDKWVVALRRLARAPWGMGLAVQKDDLFAKERLVGQQMLLTLAAALFLGIAIVSAISRRLTEPISQLAESTEALARGDLSVRVNVHSGDELEHLGHTFNVMAESLQEKERSIQQFIRDLRSKEGQLAQAEKLSAVGQLSAGIAHEINNPLGGIILSARIVERASSGHSALDAELLRKHCGLIGANVSRAQEITRALLDYSRKSAEELKLSALDPNPLLEKTVLLLHHELKKRQFHSRLESRGIIRADSTRLQQIVVNLLVNAVHATQATGCVTLETADVGFTEEDLRPVALAAGMSGGQSSGITGESAEEGAGRRRWIPIASANPTLQASPGDAAVRIAVIDDGLGIHPRDLPRIFDPFFTTKPPGEGTGLGLSIVLGMVAAMSGCIAVETELGKGTTFAIKFPVSHKGPA